MSLVFGVDFVPKARSRRVEDDSEMRWPFPGLRVLQQLEQHVAKPGDGTHRQPVTLAGKRWQRVKGAKNVPRAIDQVEVVTLPDPRPRIRPSLVRRQWCPASAACLDNTNFRSQ
jgi:hypothetical protein